MLLSETCFLLTMNEIEVQKQMVKLAFGKQSLALYNLVEGGTHATDGSQGVRHYIWKVAGYI